MSRRPNRLAALSFVALGGLGATQSCSGDLLGDPSFDLWCGGDLCSWEVEVGEVQKVATWHAADSGAALVGGVVALSQHSDADAADADCIRFSLTADVDPGAQLSVEMDFFDDGSVEVSHPLVSDDFESVSYTVRPPDRFEGIRFRVRKVGEARAVLAQIRAQAVDRTECPDAPLVITDQPDGTACDLDGACASGHCAVVPLVSSFGDPSSLQTCGECELDADCGGGRVCGLGWDPDRFHGHRACVEPASKDLGLGCVSDAECAHGACTDDQCSTCGGDADCGGGDCAAHDAGPGDADPAIMPHTCDPAGGRRAAGEPCLVDADCTSDICESAAVVRICDPDGRPCTVDAGCPYAELGGACVTIGPADGRCG